MSGLMVRKIRDKSWNFQDRQVGEGEDSEFSLGERNQEMALDLFETESSLWRAYCLCRLPQPPKKGSGPPK